MMCPNCQGQQGIFTCQECYGVGIVHCCEGDQCQPEPEDRRKQFDVYRKWDDKKIQAFIKLVRKS